MHTNMTPAQRDEAIAHLSACNVRLEDCADCQRLLMEAPTIDADGLANAVLQQLAEEADELLPHTLTCYRCVPITGVERRVLSEGPITDSADPTQTYRLECGHTAI